MALASGYFVKTGALALIELNAMDNFDTKLARLDATGVRLGHWTDIVLQPWRIKLYIYIYIKIWAQVMKVKLDNCKEGFFP